jgi:thiamine pyrophosphokinase
MTSFCRSVGRIFFMARTIIFANGELNPPLPTSADFSPEDRFIAADGGALHCANLHITPHTLIGDFDSLPPDFITDMTLKGIQIIRYPTHKDETDLELAILHAVHQGADEIVVLGALGARWDMTLANLMLLTHPAFQHTQLRLVDGIQEISLLRGGQSLLLNGRKGDTVSLIPLSPSALGITINDLEYPLQNGALRMGFPRGVSNVMLSEQCQISLKSGLLAVVHLGQEQS